MKLAAIRAPGQDAVQKSLTEYLGGGRSIGPPDLALHAPAQPGCAHRAPWRCDVQRLSLLSLARRALAFVERQGWEGALERSDRRCRERLLDQHGSACGR